MNEYIPYGNTFILIWNEFIHIVLHSFWSRFPPHSTLTKAASSEKFNTKTEDIPALFGARALGPSSQPSSKYKQK